MHVEVSAEEKVAHQKSVPGKRGRKPKPKADPNAILTLAALGKEPAAESPGSSEYELDEEVDDDNDEGEEGADEEGEEAESKKKLPGTKRTLTNRAPLQLKAVRQVPEETASIMKHSFKHKGFPTNKAIILLAFANIPGGTAKGLSVKQMGMYAQAQKALREKYDSLSKWRRVIGQTLPSYPKDFRLEGGLWVWLSQKEGVGVAAVEQDEEGEEEESDELRKFEEDPTPAVAPDDAMDRRESTEKRKAPAKKDEGKGAKKTPSTSTERYHEVLLTGADDESHGDQFAEDLDELAAGTVSQAKGDDKATTTTSTSTPEHLRVLGGHTSTISPESALENAAAAASLSSPPPTLASPPAGTINAVFNPFKQKRGGVVSED